jgi:hypothetical protein
MEGLDRSQRRGGRAQGLEFVQGSFRAFDEDFVVNDRGVEGRDEFEEVGLAFDEVGEEIGIVGGQGLELVEERLFRLQLLTKRKTRVAVHEYIQAAWARRDATRMARSTWCGCSPDAGNSQWGAGNLPTGAPSGPLLGYS